MILTYYQSVELMAFLPVLLSPCETNESMETASADIVADDDNAKEDISGVYRMWNSTAIGMEVNGADFY